MKKIRQLHSRGKKVVFPDIDRLEQIMLAEVKDNATEYYGDFYTTCPE